MNTETTIATQPSEPAPANISPDPGTTQNSVTGSEPELQSQNQHQRPGNGKVARLPRKIRDQISHLILDNIPYKQIIANLGEEAPTLNEDNISEWKKYGYQSWLADFQRSEALVTTRDAAITLVEKKAATTVVDAGRTIASAQLYELLLSFDPRSFAGALQEKPELYLRLINSLSRLSEGEAAFSRLRAQGSAIEDHLNSADKTPDGNVIISPEKLNHLLRLIKLL